MTNSTTVVLELDGETRVVTLDGDETAIGRAPTSAIVVDHASVSREHAVLQRQPDGAHLLIDLGSTNGTVLNGRPLTVASVLRDGDVIEIGPAVLTFRRSAARDAASDWKEEAHTERAAEDTAPLALLGRSPAMARVFRQIERAAASPIAVLVLGETGSGKELVARAIAAASARADGPFVAVNCAALPEALFESELFGHRRGAFTGAHQDHRGVLERASGGTLFLDEVGEMPLAVQAKLLRVLQEGEMSPLGAERPRRVDVRVVSATNRALEDDVASGRFRADLYFRIAAFTINLPPLRERLDDVPLLARRMLNAAAARQAKRIRGLDAGAQQALLAYRWPGNVRELQNEIERAVALADDGAEIGAELFSDALRGPGAARAEAAPAPPGGTQAKPEAAPKPAAGQLREARAAFEAEHIARILAAHGGNISRAARELGLSRTALYKKIKEHGLGA